MNVLKKYLSKFIKRLRDNPDFLRYPDQTFWGLLPKDLPSEKETILSLLRKIPILNEEQLKQFNNGAIRDKDIIEETGTTDETVEFAISKIMKWDKLIWIHVAGIVRTHIQCQFSKGYIDNCILILNLWREFGGVNSDYVYLYIIRESETLCKVRYMPLYK